MLEIVEGHVKVCDVKTKVVLKSDDAGPDQLQEILKVLEHPKLSGQQAQCLISGAIAVDRGSVDKWIEFAELVEPDNEDVALPITEEFLSSLQDDFDPDLTLAVDAQQLLDQLFECYLARHTPFTRFFTIVE